MYSIFAVPVDRFVMLLGILMAFQVHFVGNLFYTEIVFVLMFIYYICRNLHVNFSLQKNELEIYILLTLYLFAQVVSNSVNDVSFEDSLKGIFKIVFLGINFFVLMRFLINSNTILLWFSVFSFAKFLTIFFTYPQFITVWKFAGFFLYVFFTGILLLNFEKINQKYFKYQLVLTCVFLVISFINNCRSLSLFLFCSIVLISYKMLNSNKIRVIRKISTKKFFIYIFASLSFVYIFSYSYVFLLSNNYLGNEALRKYEDQRVIGFDPVIGLLIGGRSELLASYAAIYDAPILGHGSWAKNFKYTYIYLVNKVAYTGTKFKYSEIDDGFKMTDGLIPTHSHILGAWVDCGVFGFIFWAYILVIIVRRSLYSLHSSYKIDFFFLQFSMMFLWDILFSPFGAMMRMWWASVFVCCIYFEKSNRFDVGCC